MSKISILATGCNLSTGNSVSEFMHALRTGHDSLVPVETETWKIPPKPGFEPRAFLWNDRSAKESNRSLLTRKLTASFLEAKAQLNESKIAPDLSSERVGVIFASTKGFTEDFVWENGETSTPLAAAEKSDPLTPLLDDVIKNCGLKPGLKVCVSNACASSLAALVVAKTWLQVGRVDHVVVFAGDAVDSFVLHGFHHLRVLSPDRTRPFSGKRSGFHLGDAAACVILSSSVESDFELIDSRIDSEGHAATRPSHSGESLLRACRALDGITSQSPDLIIAHGTSTQANDVTEDRVFTALFESAQIKPQITGSKWSVGHTLGAAGLLDIIAAVEILKTQKVFSIFTSDEVDSSFSSSYLVNSEPREQRSAPSQSVGKIDRVLVTSLGFGGVHAAALVGISKSPSAHPVMQPAPETKISPLKFWIRAHSLEVPFPAKETPAWAAKSDRWYQLDQAGYSFPQAYALLKERLGPNPEYLVLASPQASNATDREFALTGASSPSKFVHTLPNIRAVALLQAMEWSGPMLCVQNDPRTLLSGLEAAFLELEASPKIKSAWVIGFIPERNRVELYEVAHAKPEANGGEGAVIEVIKSASTVASGPTTSGVNQDKEWLDWVYNRSISGFNLSNSYKALFLSGD